MQEKGARTHRGRPDQGTHQSKELMLGHQGRCFCFFYFELCGQRKDGRHQVRNSPASVTPNQVNPRGRHLMARETRQTIIVCHPATRPPRNRSRRHGVEHGERCRETASRSEEGHAARQLVAWSTLSTNKQVMTAEPYLITGNMDGDWGRFVKWAGDGRHKRRRGRRFV